MADDPFKLRDAAKHFLADDIYERVKHFPKWEKFVMSQTLRQEGLALVVSANHQNHQRGAARLATIESMLANKDNLLGLTWLAREKGYIKPAVAEDWQEKIEELSKMIWGLKKAALGQKG